MGLLCIRFFNPHNCYPSCRGDSEAKWLAKGYTVRRYLTDSKDLNEIPNYPRPLSAMQESNTRFFKSPKGSSSIKPTGPTRG